MTKVGIANKKKKTNNIKLAVIIILVLCILALVNAFFFILPVLHKSTLVHNYNADGVRNFYLEKQDSLDGIYVGPSSVYRYWLAPQAYEEKGIAVYAISSSNLPISAMEQLIKDAVNRQSSIKFVAMDLRNICKIDNGVDSKYMKQLSDNMPWSTERTAAINDYLDYCENMDTDHVDFAPADYYFPILRNNGAWLTEVNKEDLLHYLRNDLNLTFKGSYPRITYVYNEPFTTHVEGIELKDYQIDMLNSLFSYCHELEDKGITVVFTFAPCNTGGNRSGYLHETAQMCKENGFTVLDFNDEPYIHEIKFDYSKDFYDNRHASYTGGEKYTKYMTEYFDSHFNLPDHRGDPDYASWDKSVKQLKQWVKYSRIENGIEE